MTDTRAQHPSFPGRFIARVPVIGRITREIGQDVNNIFWLIPVLILWLVLGIQTWGLAALAMTGLAMVPLVFAFFIAICWP